MADNSPFQVSWSAVSLAVARDIVRSTHNPEDRASLLQAFQTLIEQLQQDPCAVGTLYRVEGVIEKRFAITVALRVDFSVDTLRHLVHVQTVMGLWRGNGQVTD